MAVIDTALGRIELPDPTSVATTGFSDIDALIRQRTPEALGLIESGTTEALRLADLASAQVDPLRQFAGLEAFDEQQAILGLAGEEAQQLALAGLPVSEADLERQMRERQMLERGRQAAGDISGATLRDIQQLSAGQQMENIQTRLAELEPLADIARSTRGTLSQQAEAARARRAQLLSGEATQKASIRLGATAPQVSSIMSRAELSGLQQIQAANQRAQQMNTLANLAGRFMPQQITPNYGPGGFFSAAVGTQATPAPVVASGSINPLEFMP